jgi:pilus assembly protein Flp/PilA
MVTYLWTTVQSRMVVQEEGASLVEYALLLALIALVAIAAVQIVGTNVSTDFNEIANNL